MKILKETCLKNDCEPIIGFITNSPYWEPNPLTETFKNQVKNFTSKNNIYFIDFTNEINSLGDSARAPKGTHMSPAGYKIIADKIRVKLSDLN